MCDISVPHIGRVIVRPKRPALGTKGQSLDTRPKGFADPRHQTEIGGKLFFQRFLDRTRQNRCRAFGADGNRHRVTVHDGGGDELAIGKVVDDVNQRPIAMGKRGHPGIFAVIFICGIEEGGA